MGRNEGIDCILSVVTRNKERKKIKKKIKIKIKKKKKKRKKKEDSMFIGVI